MEPAAVQVPERIDPRPCVIPFWAMSKNGSSYCVDKSEPHRMVALIYENADPHVFKLNEN